MDTAAALSEIEALRSHLDEACDRLMTQAETGLALAREDKDAGPYADIFSEILSLCGFQDLAGQRLSRLADGLAGVEADGRSDAHLLNGPSTDGLDQASADALLDDR